MPNSGIKGRLTPLQAAIYETDQLGVNLRDSMRIVTTRIGFFVAQERYLKEREKIAAILAEHGEAAIPPTSPTTHPGSTQHQVGSAS